MSEGLVEDFEKICLDHSKRKWIPNVKFFTEYKHSASVACEKIWNEFTIVSYNVLADGERYALSEKHGYCPRVHIDWKSRLPRIIKEIQTYKADIICLQEVKKEAYEKDFVPAFSDSGYSSSNSRLNLASKYGDNIATATFIRRESFELLCTESHLIRDHLEKQKGSKEFRKKFERLNNSVVLNRLRHIQSQRIVVVANVHLFWDPYFNHVKSYQMATVCRLLNSFSDEGDSIIICGDFNSLPYFQPEFLPVSQYNRGKGEDPNELLSGVYRLLTRGLLTQCHPCHPDSFDKRFPLRPGGDKCEQFGDFDTGLGPFRNVYAEVSIVGSNHCFQTAITTKTDQFHGVIDYIFWRGHMEVVKSLQLPRVDEIQPIPNYLFPSDHLAIGSVFHFT